MNEEIKMKTNRILVGIGIFFFGSLVSIGLFLLVWDSAPKESVLWLKENYNGFFQYLLIVAYGLSTTTVNLKQSIDLSKKIVGGKTR